MKAGLALLAFAYVLSQFFRAFLAVLAPALQSDLGAGAEALAFASGLWFFSFAAMQIPVGWALDRLGPRRTASLLLTIGGAGGTALFALATTPGHVAIAMALIGVGCAPVLMASYYIFARQFPARQFATLAALMVGLGSVGNLIASWPMAVASEALGWRGALWGLAALCALTALGIALLVRDPVKPAGEARGGLGDLLRLPALWLVLPMMFVSYAPAAALRGLWVGPYLADSYALSTTQIGQATLVMGIAMILGTLAYGPLDRMLGTRKWVVFGGNAGALAVLAALALIPTPGAVVSAALLAALGFFGASYPLMIAHGRGFMPPHLVGRGVTLLNLFGIGGVGFMQFASGRIHGGMAGGAVSPYPAIFGFFGLALAFGMAIYLFSRDSTD